MHYWNRDNFEGLQSIGEKYSPISGYELFGKYCLQKEQGLKKQAVTAIKEFVASTSSKPIEIQREISEELASLAYWNGHIHQLLSHPLVEFLQSVFQQWTYDEVENPVPYKWLGYVAGDLASYKKALLLNPNDEICISRIAMAHLYEIDYQTHHLSESQFLGDFKEAEDALDKAQALVSRLTDLSSASKIQHELDDYRLLLNCWHDYSSLKPGTPFPDWCASKGHDFGFSSIVYYEG